MAPLPDPERKPAPALLWFALGAIVIVLFAALVVLVGGPADVGLSDKTDPAAVASQPPINPPDKGIVVN